MDIWELSGQKGDEHCKVSINLHSKGVGTLSLAGAEGFLSYSLPRLQLQLAVIFLFTQCLHLLLRRWHFPRIVPELLAGIILGKTIMGRFIPSFTARLFPIEGEIFLKIIARMGYIFFMFLIGVKMDPTMVSKTGRKAWTIGLVSVFIPMGTAVGLSGLLDRFLPIYRRPTVRSIIAIQTLTPFPVIACLLMDLKIINSELGRLALASALISDLLSTTLSTIVSIIRIGTAGWTTAIMVQSLFLTIVLILAVMLARQGFLWIIKRTPEGKPVRGIYVTLIAAGVLLSAITADNMGLQYQFGPFLLGLSVPVGPPLGSTLVDKLEALTSGLFAPLMLAHCAMKVDLLKYYDLKFLRLLWGVFIFSAGLKALTTFIPAVVCKVPFRDAIALSIIMNAQGIVEMASYLHSFINQTIDGETFALATLSVIIMAIVASLLERYIYDYSRKYTGYQKRDILHSTYNSELRILVCAHRQDDAFAAINLLEVSNPTKESPIAAYALNLVELLGRSSPLLINHGLGQRTSSGGSYSQQMIDTFRYYERQHPGLVNVQVFTAMSLHKFMHEDICALAFDKLMSLIILPFHRKWNYQGQMTFDSNILRGINRHVLDTAPCSVGILVDRRKISRTSAVSSARSGYNVAIIFLGGDDDREALAYGKRMANSLGVYLTVVRVVPLEYKGEDRWEVMLDAENLKDIRIQGLHQGNNIVYREESVKDGSQTAGLIHSIVEDFDLIIVGRRHREDSTVLSGLGEWNELPELGPLGDMLASADIDKPVSVLVVQQQLLQVK